MSILGSISNSSGSMNGPTFHEFKKQASFFLKEKIKTARLALTDVTPVQLLAEEATNGYPELPDARTLKIISRAAFEVDDYWRIVEILHKRLVRFDRGNWRASYKALIVLEHLLTHGPERVAEEFQIDREGIRQMESFQIIDGKGFNWGLNVRKKSERILDLLEKVPLLKEERNKARKISRGIQGFGSFCLRTTSGQESSLKSFDRCNSDFTHHTNQQDLPNENDPKKDKNLSIQSLRTRVDSPDEGVSVRELRDRSWSFTGESKPQLRAEQKDDSSMEDGHPFDDVEHLTAVLLLVRADEVQGC